MKILILEDQINTQVFLDQHLKIHYPEAEVLIYANLKDASNSLKKNKIDLILTDLDFDGEKEFSLLSIAHELNIPCIIYSAHYNLSYIEKAKQYDFCAFICKLGKIEDLSYAIKNFQQLKHHTCQFIHQQHKKEELIITEPILTAAQKVVLQNLIYGRTREEIAAKLKIKTATLYSYLRDMTEKNQCNLNELIFRYTFWHKE